jgi:hypothetical protein
MFAHNITSVALAPYLQWMYIIIFPMLVLLPILTNLHVVADTNKKSGDEEGLSPTSSRDQHL